MDLKPIEKKMLQSFCDRYTSRFEESSGDYKIPSEKAFWASETCFLTSFGM